MDLGLKGKRVLVTAASKGLGRAVAEALVAEGCRVCISSREDAHIRAVARELAAERGEVHARAADIAKASDCTELFDWTVQTLGGLDILINNTGGPPAGGVTELDEAQWRHAFESILISAIRLEQIRSDT